MPPKRTVGKRAVCIPLECFLVLLPPANVVCEGYVFTRVCHSFCSEGGVPDQVHPPGPGPHPPGADTPHPRDQVHPPVPGTPEQTPPRTRYTPPRADPPRPGTPPDQSMLGDTVNMRAVCILLECNLVFVNANQTYFIYYIILYCHQYYL